MSASLNSFVCLRIIVSTISALAPWEKAVARPALRIRDTWPSEYKACLTNISDFLSQGLHSYFLVSFFNRDKWASNVHQPWLSVADKNRFSLPPDLSPGDLPKERELPRRL